MSRPRSRSPRYRRFPWEEPDFDPGKVLAELDRDSVDRGRYAGEDHEEHLDFLGTDMYPEDQRRYPPVSDDRPFTHQRRLNQEDFYHRRPSPCHDAMAYDDRRLSPLCDGGRNGSRGSSGVRERSKSFENRRRSPYSPLRLPREQLPSTPRSHSDHQRREPGMDWRREEQGRAPGRFRDLSPSGRTDDQGGRAGWERGRRNTLGPNRERHREDSHQERNPPFKRQRREMDDGSHLGYRNEEDFDEQRYSVDTHTDSFGGDTQESLPRGDIRHPGPLVIEHDHGIAHGREPSRWKQFDDRRDRDPDFDRQRSPRPMGSSQEPFRTSESRLDPREDGRGRHFQDNWREADSHQSRRSPTPQDRPNTVRYGNHRGRGGPRQARGRASHGQSGRTGPQRSQPRQHESSQGYQDVPHEEQRPGYRPFREDYENPTEEEVDWAEETRPQQWKRDRPESLGRRPPNIGFNSKTPHQRMHEWNDQNVNNMTVTTEETLTVKVDMSRPANKNSSLCYSSDRQLSLDLVNVGRQRLDFLPMLEHSGTYRETAMHTGTFAQEIITLVHHVKEQYFRDSGLTLTERFSAPQKGEAEMEELTLDERFSPNRGFSLNMNSLLDDDEPLFSRLGPLQPMRAPGDLRHDLERRRQERLEGVKVTISGSGMSQRPLGAGSEPGPEYRDRDEMDQMEDEGFSKWPEEQSRRREGNMAPRRGASHRPNNGFHRRNNRFGNRLGPMRRQNNHNNPAGPNW